MALEPGTAAYMSPEQAKGKEVDRRADIWAFGACLYEALSGQRTFAAADHALAPPPPITPKWARSGGHFHRTIGPVRDGDQSAP